MLGQVPRRRRVYGLVGRTVVDFALDFEQDRPAENDGDDRDEDDGEGHTDTSQSKTPKFSRSRRASASVRPRMRRLAQSRPAASSLTPGRPMRPTAGTGRAYPARIM